MALALTVCCFIGPQSYVKADAATTTITFDSNGGTAVSPITAPCASTLTIPAAPTKEGYTFAGWSPSFPSAMPLNGETLTAQWTPNNYTIAFNTSGASTYTAAPGDPTVDGVINPGEYGPTYLNDSTNASAWTGSITSSVKYSFAWSSKGLYVAVSNPTGVAGNVYGGSPMDNYQINVDPDNKIPSGDPGIFFSFYPNKDGTVKVLRHNYQTPDVGSDAPVGYNISRFVNAKVNTTNGISMEVFIPTAQLQVVGVSDPRVNLTGWTPTADSTIRIGLYTIQWTANGMANAWTSVCGAGVSPSYLNLRAFIVDSLSTMTLASVPPITAAYDSTLTAPTAPTKPGYTFAGWSPSFPSTMPLNGETLTAQWTPNNAAPTEPLYFNIPNSKIIGNLNDGTYDSRYPTNITVEIPSTVTAIKASDISASNNDAISLYTSPDFAGSDKVGDSGYALAGNTATLYLSATNATSGTVKYYQLNIDKVDSTAYYKLSAPATFTKEGLNYVATVTIDRQQAEKMTDPKLFVIYTIQSGPKQFQICQTVDVASSDTSTTKDIVVSNGFVKATAFLVNGTVDWSQGLPTMQSNPIIITMK